MLHLIKFLQGYCNTFGFSFFPFSLSRFPSCPISFSHFLILSVLLLLSFVVCRVKSQTLVLNILKNMLEKFRINFFFFGSLHSEKADVSFGVHLLGIKLKLIFLIMKN